jgi:predicted flavoprotein YhiN
MKIESGSGNGREAKVGNENRLYVDAKTIPEKLISTKDGNAYNLNTGIVSISATTGMMYVKNNEDKDLAIEAVIIGTGAGSYNTTGEVQIQITRNPSTGTLIESTPTNVDQNANRNFGSSNTLSVTAYKAGASGDTITNGTDIILIGAPNAQARTAANIDLILQKGNSIGIEVNPNLASGSVNCYVALIVHLITET